MSWLGERQDELSRAKAAKTVLESQVQFHLEWKKEQKRKMQKLSTLIHEYTKLHRKISLRVDNAEGRRLVLQDELEDADRAIKLCVL